MKTGNGTGTTGKGNSKETGTGTDNGTGNSTGIAVYIDMFSGSIPCLLSFEFGEVDYNKNLQEIIRALSFTDEDEIHDYIIAVTLEHNSTRFWDDYNAQQLQLPTCAPEKKALIDAIFSDGIIIGDHSGHIMFISQSEQTWDLINDKHMLNMFACAVWAVTPKKNINIVPSQLRAGKRHFCKVNESLLK